MSNLSEPKYKRVLLKLSGEALKNGKKEELYDMEYIESIANVIKECVKEGVQVAIIVGAGNIWRGKFGKTLDRVHADYMGMLATTINALALRDVFNSSGIKTVAMCAIEMQNVADVYSRDEAIKHLENGEVVILGGGLGSPFFTTDTAAVLRAAELNVDVVLMAKNIDGIYDADPKDNPNAKRYDVLTYEEILTKHLKAIDATAAAFALDNNLKMFAFGLKKPENILSVINGNSAGTLIKGE